MLNLNYFDNLIHYYEWIKDITKNENIFFVWWIIRDILLGIKTDNFTDIDVTCSWTPDQLYDNINKKKIHIFQTKKFWTITVLPEDKSCQYEITPFRKEWLYKDLRHPSQIEWTDNLIMDSKRRDFTINSIYYTFVKLHNRIAKTKLSDYFSKDIINKIKTHLQIDDIDTKFEKKLKSLWAVFIKKYNILILQSEEFIEKIVVNWKLNKSLLKAILPDVNKLHIIADPAKWINDIIHQKLKAVWNPDDRIQEDTLRIIRAIRFIAMLNNYEHINFDFDSKTWLSCKKYYYTIPNIAKERIIQEIIKVFKDWNPFSLIALMDELNILKYIFPALYTTICNRQPTRYHPFDTYTHSLLALYHLQKINKNYLVRFGILYHDVGKPDQYRWASIKMPDEQKQQLYKSYVNHYVIWADLAKKDFERLGFSNKQVEEIVFYVEKHLLPGELLNMSDRKRKKYIIKYLWQFWLEKFLNLCDIAIADRLWQYNPLQHSDIKGIYDLKEKIKDIFNQTWQINLKSLDINWNDLIKHLNLQPWPIIGEILEYLLNFVISNPSKNKKKILIEIAKKYVNKK